jgi:DUF4097 and DUF4098 domain-containing protein YvlB
MKNKFLFTVILTSICLLIFAIKTFAQDDYTTKTFKVGKGGTLKMGISGGDIEVKTGNNNEVKVSYDEDYDYSGVTIYQDGNNITIKSHDYTDFEITVPYEYNLNLNTSGGNVEVSNNISGDVKIRTSGGEIELKDVNGELNASTAGGNIQCGSIAGDTKLSSSGGNIVVGPVDGECIVSTGGGNVSVENVTKRLTISTGGGNILCSRVGGDTKISTGGGDVEVKNISGVLHATTGGGNIYAENINKGGQIVTGGGDISVKKLAGNVEITSGSGDVLAEFVSMGNKASHVFSGYGDITVYIPENAKVTIEATVKYAEGNIWSVDKQEISEFIKSEFKSSRKDINKKKGEYKAVYNVNGGGVKIYLNTSVGYIEIKKLKR